MSSQCSGLLNIIQIYLKLKKYETIYDLDANLALFLVLGASLRFLFSEDSVEWSFICRARDLVLNSCRQISHCLYFWVVFVSDGTFLCLGFLGGVGIVIVVGVMVGVGAFLCLAFLCMGAIAALPVSYTHLTLPTTPYV